MDEETQEHKRLNIECPVCHRIIDGKFWGSNDYRFGCMNCGYVEVVKVYGDKIVRQ